MSSFYSGSLNCLNLYARQTQICHKVDEGKTHNAVVLLTGQSRVTRQQCAAGSKFYKIIYNKANLQQTYYNIMVCKVNDFETYGQVTPEKKFVQLDEKLAVIEKGKL